MEALVSDLRAALRALAARPAFTVVAVLTLALGIGANTAIFSAVQAVLLRPLPYRDPERLIWITDEVPEFHGEMVGGADYMEWRDSSKLLASIAAWDDGTPLTLKGREQPQRLLGARVSAGFLSTLGVQPDHGRSFLPDEEKLNGGHPAILTQRLWQRLFGTAPFSERMLRLDKDVYTVVGVLPAGFMFPRNADVDLLIPLALDEAVERSRHRMSIVQVMGRLKPGVTMAQARAELKTIQDRALATAQEAMASGRPGPGGGPGGPPGGGGGRQISIRMAGPPGSGPSGPGQGPRLPQPLLRVSTLREHLVGDVRPALLLMLAAVGLVLLIACANVANLLLARATARRQEIAIRAALGASRGQLIRLLLAESTVLGLLGGGCGLLLALGALRPLTAAMPPGLAAGLFRQAPAGVNGPVLAFTLLLAVGSAILFGLAPAVTAARPDLQNPLREGARGGGSGTVRGLLVVAEVALAVVLLAGAGLLLHSFLRLQAVDPGFDPERVLTLAVDLDLQRYPAAEARNGFYQQLAQRVRALPGVESVSYGDSLPLTDIHMVVRGTEVEGRPRLDPEQQPSVAVTVVSPEYFRTLGIRLVRGRGFTEQETAGAPPVAVISESMARKLWGGNHPGDPVGTRFRRGPQSDWMTVVGVAADIKHEGLDDSSPLLQMYRPFPQEPRPFAFLAVRSQADPAKIVRSVRREILAFDRNLPVYDVATLRERLDSSVAGRRFNLALLGLFALLALVLAGVGLYGVLAYAVAERTHEIGIRMALGAKRRRVQALILRQGLTLAGAGIVLGLPVSVLVGRLLRSSLFGVTAADPATLVLIPVTLLTVALLAAWLPARRATRVDPIVSLRNE